MAEKPEERARAEIDRLLAAAGWSVQSMSEANIHAVRGVAIREFPLKAGHGFADYLLYIDGKASGVIEAKKGGVTLTGVEIQSDRYAQGLPDELPAWNRPLPFAYQSTGIETHFTNGLDPEPRSPKLLEDNRDAAAFIREVATGKTLADYRADRVLRQAIERNFEIIGEAIRRLAQHDAETTARIGDYRQIIAFRNVLIHGYDLVDHALAWSTIESQIPTLLRDVETLLASKP